jgi:hypothetical protein
VRRVLKTAVWPPHTPHPGHLLRGCQAACSVGACEGSARV